LERLVAQAGTDLRHFARGPFRWTYARLFLWNRRNLRESEMIAKWWAACLTTIVMAGYVFSAAIVLLAGSSLVGSPLTKAQVAGLGFALLVGNYLRYVRWGVATTLIEEMSGESRRSRQRGNLRVWMFVIVSAFSPLVVGAIVITPQ
jgi:hypothetical protein